MAFDGIMADARLLSRIRPKVSVHGVHAVLIYQRSVLMARDRGAADLQQPASVSLPGAIHSLQAGRTVSDLRAVPVVCRHALALVSGNCSPTQRLCVAAVCLGWRTRTSSTTVVSPRHPVLPHSRVSHPDLVACCSHSQMHQNITPR